jgi:hypothetical protein
LDKTCKYEERSCRHGCGLIGKGVTLRNHESSCANNTGGVMAGNSTTPRNRTPPAVQVNGNTQPTGEQLVVFFCWFCSFLVTVTNSTSDDVSTLLLELESLLIARTTKWAQERADLLKEIDALKGMFCLLR